MAAAEAAKQVRCVQIHEAEVKGRSMGEGRYVHETFPFPIGFEAEHRVPTGGVKSCRLRRTINIFHVVIGVSLALVTRCHLRLQW